MSLNHYTNVAAGNSFASLFTDEPAYLSAPDNSLAGKVLYINGIAWGRIISNYFLPGNNPQFAHGLSIYDAAGAYVSSFDSTGTDLQAIVVETLQYYPDVISTVDIKDNFFVYTGVPQGTSRARLYTDDPTLITAKTDYLAGKKLYTDGVLVGTITNNFLFDGNNPAVVSDIAMYNSSGQPAAAVSAKGKVLMCLVVDTNAYYASASINNIQLQNPLTDFLYVKNTTFNNPSLVETHRILFVPASKALAQAAGNIECYVNKVSYIGSVVYDITGVVGPLGELPNTEELSSWAPGTAIVGYVFVTNINPPDVITEAILLPRTEVAYTVDAIVYGATTQVYTRQLKLSTTNVAVIASAAGVQVGDHLYFGDQDLGEIAAYAVSPINYAYAAGQYYGKIATQKVEFTLNYATDTLVAITGAQGVLTAINDSDSTKHLWVSRYIPYIGYVEFGGRGHAELVDGVVRLYGTNTIQEGVNGLVGKRLLVNSIYIGKIKSNTLKEIYLEDGTLGAVSTIYGIWQIETTDVAGRYPLATATQVSLTAWPDYPIINVEACEYGQTYHYDDALVAVYPEGTNLFAAREATQIGNQYTDHPLYHEFPKWVEHLHVDPVTGVFQLAEVATQELNKPYRAFYAYAISSLGSPESIRKFWQYGRYVEIFRDAVLAQGSGPWYTAPQTQAFSSQNIPGMLGQVTTNEGVSNILNKLYLVPTNEVAYYGKFTATKFYPVNVVTLFNGEYYIKLDNLGEQFMGYYNPSGSYITDNVVLNQDGSYSIYNGSSFVPYTNTGTPADNWQVLTKRDVYDSLVSYAQYDLVIEPTTNSYYVATLLPVGAPSRESTTWSFMVELSSLVVRQELAKTSVFEVAMSPQAFSVDAAYVALLSAGITALDFSVVQKLTAIQATPTEFMGLYQPYPFVPPNGTAGLKAVYAMEDLRIAYSTENSILGLMTPTVEQAVLIQEDIRPKVTGVTIQFKRGDKTNLPAVAAVGEPLVTLDTAELFIGTGTGVQKVSDIITSETEPGAEFSSKVWFNPASKVTSVYKDGAWHATKSSAGTDYGAF